MTLSGKKKQKEHMDFVKVNNLIFIAMNNVMIVIPGIVYDVLMDRVFGEKLEKSLRERMRSLTRFALSEKFNISCRELKQRYPPEILHCWAGRIYENTALAIAETERQGEL